MSDDVTRVSPEEFERLAADLDTPGVPNEALRAAAVRARQEIESRPADRCPCGHDMGGDYMCLNGLIYGPCGDDNCGGVCEDNAGYCKGADCRCAEDE